MAAFGSEWQQQNVHVEDESFDSSRSASDSSHIIPQDADDSVMTDEADLSSNTLNSANSIAIEMRFNSTMTMNVTDSLGIGNEGGDKKNPMQMPIDDETSTNNSNSPSQPVPRAPVYFPTTSLEAELKVSFADLYESMQSVEHEYVSFASYTPTASYLPFRRYLVDWMVSVCVCVCVCVCVPVAQTYMCVCV